MVEFTLKVVAQLIQGRVEGNEEEKVHHVASIEEAGPGTIAFLSNPKYEPYIYNSRASAVIVAESFKPKGEIRPSLIRVKDPYVAFSQLLDAYQARIADHKSGVEQPAFIDESAEIGKDVYIGAFAYIGKNTRIADGAKIYPNTYVGNQVTVGEGTTLFAGVKVYERTVIGKSCTVHAGAVIGSDGFGFAPQRDGSYKAIPQLGNVIIGDHVDIGANTTVDRATFSSTRLNDGVKLDNLVQVGHNVEIGSHTVVAALTGIAGSSKVGKFCQVGGQVGISGHISIADKTRIGAQSGVGKSVKETGTVLLGSPVLDHKSFFKSFAVFKQLPDLAQRLTRLEGEVSNRNISD